MPIEIGDSTATVRSKINAVLTDAGLNPADNVDTTAATTLLNQAATAWSVPVEFVDRMPEAEFRDAFTLLEGVGVAGKLDGLDSTPWSAASPVKLFTSWTTATVRLRRVADNVEADFTPLVSTGDLDYAAISAWTSGADPAVKILYDQTGNGRHHSQGTDNLQPLLSLTNKEVVYDGVNDYFPITNSLGFSRNVAGMTLVDVAKCIADGNNRILTGAVTPTNSQRIDMRLNSGNNRVLGARRLDGDSVFSVATGTVSALYERWIGRVDFTAGTKTLMIDGVATNATNGTTGATSDTDSGNPVCDGATGTIAVFKGSKKCNLIYQSALTDAQMGALDAKLFT